MKRARSNLLAIPAAGFAAGRGAILSVTDHWALALFSILAAFGVWVAVQDIDNPRITGEAPLNDRIPVEALNVPDGKLVEELDRITVTVEARKDDLARLKPGDFSAHVDVSTMGDQVEAELPVRVTSRRDDVRIVGSPPLVKVTLADALSKDIAVTIRTTGGLPDGFVLSDTQDASVDPQIVRVTGRADRVESVAAVTLDVPLSGVRDATYTFENDLVPRNAAGNRQDVTLSQSRGRATLHVEQVFSQRSLGLTPATTGSPAPGYMIASITVDPPVVLVSGLRAIVDGLRQPLNLEKIDVTNAQKDVQQIRKIELPPNVATDRQTVMVKVEIKPVAGTVRMYLSPALEAGTLPAALAVEPQLLLVEAVVSGPLDRLVAAKPADFRATFSGANGSLGKNAFAVRVTAPAGFTVESVEPVTVTLRSSAVIP
ncbi:MAG: hypothetical protein IT302_07320 [Dehalococcoidia bacterium]|nr:hypothetical protein [Dehalococcoidia bacterium]